MYVCIHIYMYTYIYIYIHTYMYRGMWWMLLASSKGIVAWLLRHPQNLSFRKQPKQMTKQLTPHEPLKPCFCCCQIQGSLG